MWRLGPDARDSKASGNRWISYPNISPKTNPDGSGFAISR